jgi:hypothetical protein
MVYNHANLAGAPCINPGSYDRTNATGMLLALAPQLVLWLSLTQFGVSLAAPAAWVIQGTALTHTCYLCWSPAVTRTGSYDLTTGCERTRSVTKCEVHFVTVLHFLLLLPIKATSPLPDGRCSTKRGPCVSCHICTLTHTARSARNEDTTTGTNH